MKYKVGDLIVEVLPQHMRPSRPITYGLILSIEKQHYHNYYKYIIQWLSGEKTHSEPYDIIVKYLDEDERVTKVS